MDAQPLLVAARRRSGLSIRQLAQRARTSHSAIAAYESGAKTPGAATLSRIVRACGFEIEPRLRPMTPFEDHVRRGVELEQVLALAEAFPRRNTPSISGRFPRG